MPPAKNDEEIIKSKRNISRFFVEQRHISWVMLIAVCIWGFYSYRSMPQRKDPDTERPAIPRDVASDEEHADSDRRGEKGQRAARTREDQERRLERDVRGIAHVRARLSGKACGQRLVEHEERQGEEHAIARRARRIHEIGRAHV